MGKKLYITLLCALSLTLLAKGQESDTSRWRFHLSTGVTAASGYGHTQSLGWTAPSVTYHANDRLTVSGGFAAAGSLESIKQEIERLRCLAGISDREAEAVDAEAIDRLFRSPLGQRMLHADQREREFKFSLLVDAASLGGAEGEEQLLQGVVDCCIIEEGALTVIDYKTDGVRTSEQIAARSAYYAGQLHAYAMALTRIFALPVKECVLYYLAAGEAVRVPV